MCVFGEEEVCLCVEQGHCESSPFISFRIHSLFVWVTSLLPCPNHMGAGDDFFLALFITCISPPFSPSFFSLSLSLSLSLSHSLAHSFSVVFFLCWDFSIPRFFSSSWFPVKGVLPHAGGSDDNLMWKTLVSCTGSLSGTSPLPPPLALFFSLFLSLLSLSLSPSLFLSHFLSLFFTCFLSLSFSPFSLSSLSHSLFPLSHKSQMHFSHRGHKHFVLDTSACEFSARLLTHYTYTYTHTHTCTVVETPLFLLVGWAFECHTHPLQALSSHSSSQIPDMSWFALFVHVLSLSGVIGIVIVFQVFFFYDMICAWNL